MGGGYGGGARFEWTLRVAGAGAAEMAWEEATLRVAGAGAAEMAWEEATEGERGLSGRWESLGLELQKWHGRRLRRGSEVCVYAENRWGWSCRNRMGVGYGGGRVQ